MNETIKASRSHPLIRQALVATFPEYRGRLIRIRVYDRPQWLTLAWDEGSRDEARLIDFTRGIGVLRPVNPFTNPHGVLGEVDQPEGSLLVVHSIVGGRDRGITITIREWSDPVLAGVDFVGLLPESVR